MSSLLLHSRRGVSAPGDAGGIPSGPTQTITYSVDTTTNFLNPERGWHSDRASTSDFSGLRSGQWQNTPQTLNRWIGRLDQFRDSAISQNWLNSHANVFQAARDAGIKLEMRYAYSYNPPTSPPDASASRIVQHINQLAPVWEANKDVISSFQAGFVGRWGEWNASGFGITSGRDPTTRNSIIQALIDNVPTDRMISVRYPEMSIEYLGGTVAPVNIPDTTPENERFTGTPRSRLGVLNDGFLANPTDGGTYVVDRWASNWGSGRYGPPYNFFIGQSRYSVASGETVDGLSWGWNYESGPDAIAEMSRLNWDVLNRAYSTRVINGWISSGHFDEISRRLGYRLALTSAVLPTQVTAGSPMTVQLHMQNDGFGKVYNPRPIDLVLVGVSSPVRVRLTADARRDLPLGGESKVLTYTVTTPSLPNGTYDMYLELPDPAPTLESDPRYSIRLANTGGLWSESTGRHNLGATVAVVGS